MSNEVQYGYSLDEEQFYGRYDSREEARDAAFEENEEAVICFTGVIDTPDPSDFLNAHTIIENIQCQDEFSGEWAYGWPGATAREIEELESELKKVFSKWMDDCHLRPNFYNIAAGTVLEHNLFRHT